MRTRATTGGPRRAGGPVLASWVAALALAVAAALAPSAGRAEPAKSSCVDCHTEQTEKHLVQPVRGYRNDIHFERGIGCVGCHGGDASDPDVTAMDPDKGFRAEMTRFDIAKMCVSCHGNPETMKRFNPRPYVFSMAEFETSIHAKRLAAGDHKAATCTSCHGVHGIRPKNDPDSPIFHKNIPRTCAHCHNAEYMKGYGIPTNQFDLYSGSVHGKALLERGDPSAPACNDCHGNHGAAPPGLKDVALVCGTCHGREAELFTGSKMMTVIDDKGRRGCVVCHGNHGVQHPGDEMIGTSDPGVCGRCHEPGSTPDQRAREIITRFDGLKAAVTRADTVLDRAEILGMETSRGRTSLKEASDAIVSIRVLLHSFNAEKILGEIDEGTKLANHAGDQGLGALRDWKNRRLGMGASVAAIAVLILILTLKIRAIEGTPTGDVRKPTS